MRLLSILALCLSIFGCGAGAEGESCESLTDCEETLLCYQSVCTVWRQGLTCEADTDCAGEAADTTFATCNSGECDSRTYGNEICRGRNPGDCGV